MTMLRRILLLCCYCGLGAATLVNAQPPGIQFDVASYRGRSGLVSLDIYIQFDRAQLEYKTHEDGFSTKLAAVVLLKQRGQIITFDQLDVTDQLPKSAALASGSFTRFITFDLLPGNYDLELAVTDGQGGEFDSTVQLELAAYAAQTTGISSVVLASAVQPRMNDKWLNRRGFNIYPIADNMIGSTDGLVWYYTELYGVTPEDTVLARTVITDTSGTVFANSEQTIVTADLVYPHWGALNPAGLTPGPYTLSVTGEIGEDTVSAVHSFTVLATDSLVAEPDSLSPGWDKKTRRKLERIVTLMGGAIDHLKFIALDSLGQMNVLAGQAEALSMQKPDSSVDVLSNWIERWRWIRNTDPGYRYSGRLTAPGEVLLNYGLPQSISRREQTASHWGYHTWQYGAGEDSSYVVFLELGRFQLPILSGNLPGLEMRADWQMALERGTDLAAYFAPVEVPGDTSTTEESVESEPGAEPVAAEETIVSGTSETDAPEVEAKTAPDSVTVQIDEGGIEAPTVPADSAVIDTTTNIE